LQEAGVLVIFAFYDTIYGRIDLIYYAALRCVKFYASPSRSVRCVIKETANNAVLLLRAWNQG